MSKKDRNIPPIGQNQGPARMAGSRMKSIDPKLPGVSIVKLPVCKDFGGLQKESEERQWAKFID